MGNYRVNDIYLKRPIQKLLVFALVPVVGQVRHLTAIRTPHRARGVPNIYVVAAGNLYKKFIKAVRNFSSAGCRLITNLSFRSALRFSLS